MRGARNESSGCTGSNARAPMHGRAVCCSRPDTPRGRGGGIEEADTARSIRGLSPDAEKYAKNAGTSREHKDALEKVLATNITGKAIEKFLENGKIGEYAECARIMLQQTEDVSCGLPVP